MGLYTLREEIFCGRNFYGRNFCGIYFCDFDPYSQKFLPQKNFKIDQSQKFLPQNFVKIDQSQKFLPQKFSNDAIDIFCRKIKLILLNLDPRALFPSDFRPVRV